MIFRGLLKFAFNCALMLTVLTPAFAMASGIFTLRGKLKSFTETEYTIQTKAVIYNIKKSGLNQAQIEELKSKKTGQDVDLVVSTESVAAASDVKK